MSFIEVLTKSIPTAKRVEGKTTWTAYEDLFQTPPKVEMQPDTYSLKDIAIIEMDHILFETTKELSECYSLKGFLNDCNMVKLISILADNITVEEVQLDTEEEEYNSGDEDF